MDEARVLRRPGLRRSAIRRVLIGGQGCGALFNLVFLKLRAPLPDSPLGSGALCVMEREAAVRGAGTQHLACATGPNTASKLSTGAER